MRQHVRFANWGIDRRLETFVATFVASFCRILWVPDKVPTKVTPKPFCKKITLSLRRGLKSVGAFERADENGYF